MSHRFIRAAGPDDAARIANIYNQGIEDRVATYQTEQRSAADILDWMAKDRLMLVAGDDEIRAFAIAHPYRAAAYYAGVREFSIYVAREARRQGYGAFTLEALFAEAKARGWWKLLSRVFPENTASRGLLASLGFREVGIYQRHAQLDGQWRDVVIVEKLLV